MTREMMTWLSAAPPVSRTGSSHPRTETVIAIYGLDGTEFFVTLTDFDGMQYHGRNQSPCRAEIDALEACEDGSKP
jgi:hypothetical protein